MTEPEQVTRDDLADYRRSVVRAAAHLRADREPVYEYEVGICREADRYITADPELQQLYDDTVLERRALTEHRAQINRSLMRQHDVIADKLEATVAQARRVIPKLAGEPRSELHSLIVDFADVLASILLLISAELHDG